MGKWQREVKLLAGSAIVYVVVAACSGGGRAGVSAMIDGGMDVLDAMLGSAGSTADAPSTPVKDAAAPRPMKGRDASMGTMRDAIADVVSDVSDPVRDARAQAATSCATCLGSAQRMTTADLDPDQVVTSTVSVPGATFDHASATVVATGPLIIYHAESPKGLTYYIVDSGQSCAFDPAADKDTAENVANPSIGAVANPVHHQVISGSLDRGARYEAKVRLLAGEKLCAKQVGDCACQISPTPQQYGTRNVRIRGYRPYAG